MTGRTDEVWKSASLTSVYLEGVRGAIPLAGEQIDVMLRLLAACGRPVRSFLDLGCGDGVLAAAILRRFPEARGVLADFSEPMLEAAQKRLAAQCESVRVVNADYGEAAWTRSLDCHGPFDAIVSGYSIHHQQDVRKQEVYREIYGLLSPGGIFVNIEHVLPASEWVASRNEELFIDQLAGQYPERGRDEVAEAYYRRPDKTANILAPVEAQCRWLREIGFTDVDCYLKIFELAVFGGRKR